MKERKDPTALRESISYLQNMKKNLTTLRSDDEFSKRKDKLCKCVSEVIDAVKEQSLQIDGKNKIIQRMKTQMAKFNKQQKQLKESLCESCKNKIVIMKTSSLSLQDSTKTQVIIDNSYDLLYFIRDS